MYLIWHPWISLCFALRLLRLHRLPGKCFMRPQMHIWILLHKTCTPQRPNAPIVSINWDSWKEAGMAQKFLEQYGELMPESTISLIDPEIGAELFMHCISVNEPQLIVTSSEFPIHTTVPLWQAFKESTSEISTVHPRPTLGEPYEEPTTENESMLAAIWEQCIGVHPIGINDNFYELGGHSLLFAQMAPLVSGKMGRTIPLRVFYDSLTVAEQAKILSADQKRETKEEFEPIIRIDRATDT